MSIYKGNKLVAGGSVDTHFVRRPVWNRAVAISVEQLYAGYTAPSDGMIVGLLFTNGDTSTGVSIHVNGVEIARNKAKDSDRILNVQCFVSKDNVITITGDDTTTTSSVIRFVPFEDSTVSDIEVVTPEYIRNQNILSDYETVTIGASSAAATTMQYDGFITFDKWHTEMSVVYVNNVVISAVNNVSGTSVATTVPVKKGDTVYITNQQSRDQLKARFYKLRDYTGR